MSHFYGLSVDQHASDSHGDAITTLASILGDAVTS